MARRVNETINQVFHDTLPGKEFDKLMVAELAYDDKGAVVGVIDYNNQFIPVKKQDLALFIQKLEERGKSGQR